MDLVLVRHGLSEPNRVQAEEKAGRVHPNSDDVYGRHDAYQRLTAEGRAQAAATGRWLAANGLAPSTFDERYVSILFRTIETAAMLQPDVLWLPEAKIVERDWGFYGSTPKADRDVVYPEVDRARQMSGLFARFPGGESVFDASMRVRDMLGTVSRDWPAGRVILVTHGEFMWATRFVVERLLPREWDAFDDDETQRLGNGFVLHYTRRDPEGLAPHATSLSSAWRRIVNPADPASSPFGGNWVRLPGKRRFTPEALLDIVASEPNLIGSTL